MLTCLFAWQSDEQSDSGQLPTPEAKRWKRTQ